MPAGTKGMRLVRALNVATPMIVAHSMASASSGSTSGGFGSSSSSGGFSGCGFS